MTYKSIFMSLFIAIFACVSVSFIRADDITIATCDFASLQAAIAEANGLDEAVIQLDCERIISFTHQISITGDVHLIGNEAIIFDGGGRTRLFYVADGASLTLENMTIQNGYASEFAGAVLNDGGALTINRVSFIGNEAGSGGAIYNFGALTITDSHFMRNDGEFGGVIYNDESDATITNTYFFDNDGFYGATIYNEDGVITLISSKLWENNRGSYDGFLLFNTPDALIDMRASDIYREKTIINPQGTVLSQDTHYFLTNCSGSNITDNGGNTSKRGIECRWSAPTTPTDVVVTDCDHFFGSGSLLEAVFITNKAGGTITFACSGTITFLHSLEIVNAVTINGEGNIIFYDDKRKGLFTVWTDGPPVHFDGLTFQGVANQPKHIVAIDAEGRIDATDNTLTISNCIFTYSGVELNFGILTIHNSVFTNIQAGAVSLNSVTLIMTDSTFTNNDGYFGGALQMYGDYDWNSISITNSTFTNNNAEHDGGAISVSGGVQFTITNSTFTGNTAERNGGAIYIWGASTTIQNSTFTDNTAGIDGGAIYMEDVTATIQNSTFTTNTADESGGAIRTTRTIATSQSSTFTDNTAGITGGAIFHELDMMIDSVFYSENSVYTNNACVSIVGITDLGGNVAENAEGCPNS